MQEEIMARSTETPLIELRSETLKYMGVTLLNPHKCAISRGVTVVIGPNGAGKTTLGNILEKGWNIMTNMVMSPCGKLMIRSIAFGDIHSLAGMSVAYYQQRHEATMNDDVPTVADIVGEKADDPEWSRLCHSLRLDGILDKKINYLSSGELRKLLLVNVLVSRPDILIMDNPYIGLDAQSRTLLDDTIAIIASRGTSVVMLLCNPGEIPPSTTAVIPMRELTIEKPMNAVGRVGELRQRLMSLMDYAVNLERLPKNAPREASDHDITFEMRGCNVIYGHRRIVKDLWWTVRRGECWALAGPNGAGKSVLLSLISADNPQAYSNDIVLFDRKRGSGESIWDIKRRIGYVSPEMHLYFRHLGTVVDVVAQGLADTTGHYARVPEARRRQAMDWLELLHLDHLAERRYNTLSTGEQRLVLIARTLIKQPDLLIMDEPLHGLDAARKKAVKAVVNTLVMRYHPTLIYVTHFLPEVPECVTMTKTLEKLKDV